MLVDYLGVTLVVHWDDLSAVWSAGCLVVWLVCGTVCVLKWDDWNWAHWSAVVTLSVWCSAEWTDRYWVHWLDLHSDI